MIDTSFAIDFFINPPFSKNSLNASRLYLDYYNTLFRNIFRRKKDSQSFLQQCKEESLELVAIDDMERFDLVR